MIKKIHIIVLILGFTVNAALQVKAQFLDDEFCGNKEILNLDLRKKPWKGANTFLYNYLKQINYSENKDSVRYIVPLKFWIYESKDRNIRIADSTIKRFMFELNYYQQLNKTGFRYYIKEISRINKNKHIKLGYFIEAPWQTMVRKDKGCINIYVAQTIDKKIAGNKYMVRGTFNTLTDAVLIQYNSSSTGLSHEIGHYFGLLHPHRNYNKGKARQECVSRTRTFKGPFRKGLICEKNGDGLADTPAEPKLSRLVDNDCNFIGTLLKDRWGDNYQSNTNNIMSYPTHYRCRKVFTKGQKAVMLYSASQNKYASNWTTAVEQNKKYNFDKYEPDNNFETASIINAGETQKHNFHSIFTVKKNKHLFDKEDWLKLQLENASDKILKIEISSAGNTDIPLKIKIYDSKINLLKEKEVLKNKTELNIKINTGKKNIFYIVVINKNEPVNQTVEYTVTADLI